MSDGNNIPDADFSFVRYANCWEDANLLVKALQPSSGKRFLSIASAGDNSFSLVASGAEVVAADLNPAQLACAELRKEAIRSLDRDHFLRFGGILEADDRMATYQAVRGQLSPNAQNFWDGQSQALHAGFIHAGKFENYFCLFRTRILPLIHSKRMVSELLEPKGKEDRIRFYERKWNNRRWNWLFRCFFSRQVMGRHGRDPEFFRHVEGSVADRILERTKYALTELDTTTNPYLEYILTGNFGQALPHYLEENHYEAIRSNIDNLSLQQGAIDAVAEQVGTESFDGFNLSDIFEYLTPSQCEKVYRRLLSSARPQARLAYWNMLVPRSCPESLKNRVVPLEDEAQSLFDQDQAFFYSRFIIEETR